MISPNRPPLPLLLTDMYQLTMAFGYWKNRVHEREAIFHLFFRKNPFGGGFAIACGLHDALNYLANFQLRDEEAAYLAELKNPDGSEMFSREFIAFLRELRLRCDVDAVPEGTAVFPHEPLLRVRGPLLECQLLETTLLNIINFQTLIATKAARVCQAAQGDPVLEFGVRRAQGPDGGLTASRAAYAGGCAATSNMLAGQYFGIPVRGTHAHSWVMAFESEEEAFRAYADVFPASSILLVDTYDTIEGVRTAIRVGERLKARGKNLGGIRLDSGDLAELSVEARRMLDAAGFTDARIVASNDLDEHVIESLKSQGAKIDSWGVGTRLATAKDDPALGGIYKLAAVREPGGEWRHRLKVSEQQVKTTTPGMLQVRRFIENGKFACDMIFNELDPPRQAEKMHNIFNTMREHKLPADAGTQDILAPALRDGVAVYQPPPLDDVRKNTLEQLEQLPRGVKRFLNPHEYPVGLEPGLHELKSRLVREAASPPSDQE